MKIVPYPRGADTDVLVARSLARLHKLIEIDAPDAVIDSEKLHLVRLLGTTEVGEA